MKQISTTLWKEKIQAVKLVISWTYYSSKALTLTVFAVTLLGGLLAIVEPYLFKLVIDYLTSTPTLTPVEKTLGGVIGILIIYGLARIVLSLIWEVQTLIKKVHSQKLDKYVSNMMMEKISSLDATYFEDPAYYNTLTKANQSFWRINEFFWQFTFLLGQLVSATVIIITLLTFNWMIVVLIICAACPAMLLAFKNTKVEWGVFDAYSPVARQAEYYRNLMTSRPQAIKEIKLFGLQTHFLKKFNILSGEYIQKQQKASLKLFGTYTIMVIIEGIFSVLAAGFILQSYLQGSITLGQLTFFWALLFQFSEYARWIVRLVGDLNSHSVFITPFVKILSFRSTIKESFHPVSFPKNMQNGIEFRNVTFYYPGAKKPTLKNVNLTIKPGESIALVGENGSGKTTLIKLLCRLYDVTEGEILIDGKNIKEYALTDLYENLGVIFQDFMQYESLIQENIGYGNLKEITKKEKIHQAALKSEAWNFIKDLKENYQTHLGKTLKDEGTELSGGQWQKIALSRAFFRDAQLLILDEPTAAVDAKAEYQIFKRFENLTKNKTTILISHRFSTVRMAHKIVVLEKGEVIEQGSHHELLRNNKTYAHLFKLQAKSYQ